MYSDVSILSCSGTSSERRVTLVRMLKPLGSDSRSTLGSLMSHTILGERAAGRQ